MFIEHWQHFLIPKPYARCPFLNIRTEIPGIVPINFTLSFSSPHCTIYILRGVHLYTKNSISAKQGLSIKHEWKRSGIINSRFERLLYGWSAESEKGRRRLVSANALRNDDNKTVALLLEDTGTRVPQSKRVHGYFKIYLPASVWFNSN